jgi:hypothetical protein
MKGNERQVNKTDTETYLKLLYFAMDTFLWRTHGAPQLGNSEALRLVVAEGVGSQISHAYNYSAADNWQTELGVL